MFWEDINQANDRLQSTYVMHGDSVLYVERAENNGEGMEVLRCTSPSGGGRLYLPLDDPLWNDFHTLPPMGYMNYVSGGSPLAILLSRRPERSRSHGIRTAMVTLHELREGGPRASENKDFSSIVMDPGYKLRTAGAYPTAEEILEGLDVGTSAALSPSYAISKDAFGLFRLYRKATLVGLVTGKSVQLHNKATCYREEILETGGFNNPMIEVMA